MKMVTIKTIHWLTRLTCCPNYHHLAFLLRSSHDLLLISGVEYRMCHQGSLLAHRVRPFAVRRSCLWPDRCLWPQVLVPFRHCIRHHPFVRCTRDIHIHCSCLTAVTTDLLTISGIHDRYCDDLFQFIMIEDLPHKANCYLRR